MVDPPVQSLIPVVMSGILAVYALVISVLIAGTMKPPSEAHYTLFAGFLHMAAGLSVGLTGLAAGYAIGIVGDMVCPKTAFNNILLTWLGRARVHATVEDIRWHGADSDFCGSPRTIWVRSPCLC